MTGTELEQFLRERIAQQLEKPVDSVGLDEEFALLGLNSVHAVSLTGELEDRLGRSLEPSLVYEYPTIRQLSQYLNQNS